MNKPFYILLFVFVVANGTMQSYAQTNLIYNGDFELYDTCPVTISSPSTYQIETCLGWKSPTYATSDYYNSCATWPVSIPGNTFGFQSPYSGDAYCGILIEHGSPPFGSYGYWFEYLQGNLTSILKSGYEYEFSCRVVLANPELGYALSKIGAVFSPTTISRIDAKPFSGVIPQVLNLANSFLTDTLNWIEVKGRFIANGVESYVTLGFFSDTINLDTLRTAVIVPDPRLFQAYYYVDFCSLYETGSIYQFPNVFSPNGDNQNDEWNPNLKEGESLSIYNRWGIEVFKISKQNQTWDGRTMAGIDCVDGVYYFIAKGYDEKVGHSKKGFIQLLR